MRKTETVTLKDPGSKVTLDNIHKVPRKAWNQWNLAGRQAFNRMMSILSQQKWITHPGYELMADEAWQTIRWNASWKAADLASAVSYQTAIGTLGLVEDAITKLKSGKVDLKVAFK
jgi:hypothetical protein